MQPDSDTVMITTQMFTAIIGAIGVLIAGIFTGVGALLKLWWDKGAKARVQIINAQAAADAENNERELQAAKTYNEDLMRRLTQLEENHRKCDQDRAECREDLARLRGYMDGKFDKIELKVTALETKEAVIPHAPNILHDPHVENNQ